MMRQGGNPQHEMHTLRQQHAEDDDIERAIILSSVTNEQRAKVLGSHGKNALCNHEKKKSLANSFIDLKGGIINDIAMVDPNSNLNLMGYVESVSYEWKSKNKVKYIKNEELIPCVLCLFDIAESLSNGLDELAKQQLDLARTTRYARQPTLTPTQKFYAVLRELKSSVDQKIVNDTLATRGSTASNKLASGLTLPLSMVGRRFDYGRIPIDEKERNCPFCWHPSLITVLEDDGIEEENDDVITQHSVLLSKWGAFEKQRDAAVNNGDPPPPFPTNQFKNNKEIKSCPRSVTAKQLKKARRLCVCITSQCSKERSPVGNSCIIMCRDHPSTDRRGVGDIANDTTLPFFPWAQTPRGHRCTCHICKCNCNKLFFVDDMQSLGLVLQGSSSLPIIPKPATETRNFIAQTLMNADQVVRDATYAASRHGTVITSEHRQELYYTGAADWASRMGSNLSLSTKNSLGRTFGRDTIVDLPSGDSFNTRSISTNLNAHARNNRFSAGSNARSVAPGMLDNLNPNTRHLSDKFVTAVGNPNNLANMMNSFAQSNNGSASVALAPVTQDRQLSALAKEQLQDFGDDDEEALQVAVLHSANYATGNDDDDGGGGKRRARNNDGGGGKRRKTAGNDDDDDDGGGGKRRARNNDGGGGKRRNTAGNDDDDDDDGGGGKQRAMTTGNNDGDMHLSQTSTGSDPEVVKVRGRNIVDYTANRNELTALQRKVAVTLTKNLSRPYDRATINHLSTIREEEYDTPQKVEVLRNAIEDDMI